MNHRPYRWHWSDPGTLYGEYVHSERTVRLHPRLLAKKRHDELWATLGHEFVHQMHKDPYQTPNGEKRAYKHEKTAGEVLHDFYHRFRRAGLPLCNGDNCHINEHNTRVSQKRNRKR